MVHKGKKAYLKKQKVENESNDCDKPKSSKKAKIIVRNLPFKNLSEKSVEELFKEYGDIEEVKLLKKDDGKFVGCGFVQFTKVTSAVKAIHNANQKEIYGRKIIVDWALPKNTFLEKAQRLEEQLNEIKSEVWSDEDEDNKIEFSIDKKPDAWRNGDEQSDEEEDEDDDSAIDDDDDDDDGDGDDDSDGDDESQDFKNNINISQEKQMKVKSNDVDEGKTVFIRNLPFSATNEDLKECIESYGPVEYALVCIDKLTEHSKGTGFVKFKDKESASKCIKDSMKIFLHENPLSVTIAISKESLEDRKKSQKTVKDSRNLYLIREGVVIAGSKAATGVSATDMGKRLQLEQWKTQILKNLNMFVSRTRLVVHNLPASYTDAKLKQLFLKHSNPKAIIREAKVMFDKKKVDGKGNCVSKEVGFVSFVNHDDALTALRNINNNPVIFNPKKRPIVAFSIENKAVINAKQRSVEKSRAKLGISNEKPNKLSKLNRKQRRFIRRRQKIIEKRREAKKMNSEESTETKPEIKKRKRTEKVEPSKKLKTYHSNPEPDTFAGVISEQGKKVKLRSRFKLKTQASIHRETLKKEKQRRKEKKNKKMEPIKQPKQKKGKTKLLDDAKLSKLISKHRESIQNSSVVKKWYDN